MDRGKYNPADIRTLYTLNNLSNDQNICILNTYETFGNKKSSIASNALVSNDPNMYMLLPPEMRNNVQPVLPDINGENVLPDRNR
jgi:hypothetical protein